MKDVSDGQGGETDTVLKCPQLHTDTLEGRKINTPRNIQGNQQVEGILFIIMTFRALLAVRLN